MAGENAGRRALAAFGYPFRTVRGHPRLFIGLATAALAAFATPAAWACSTRLLIGWNFGALVYFILSGVLVATSDCDKMRRRARTSDEGRIVILIITCVAAAVSMAAIFAQLGATKDMKLDFVKGLHIALAAATIVTAWTFIHLTFALHYAHEFFDDAAAGGEAQGDGRGRPLDLAGGLRFPGTDVPDYFDFLYFSFIIGVASQTADVELTSREMRRVSLAHSIIAFFFNSAVLALTINIAAGLMN
ncbi:DUF1345 domain-containing protein [Methylocella sp.]|uniref:DUF1345 domain-containing protein n=1 Tax=Methylocella sp. TaxID=1978226 RepID=UPI00378489CB